MEEEGSVRIATTPRNRGGLWYSSDRAEERAKARIAECRSHSSRYSVPKPFSKEQSLGGRNPDFMTMDCLREEVVRMLEESPLSEKEIMDRMGRTRPLKKQLRALWDEGTIEHAKCEGEWKWALEPSPIG